MNTLPIIALLTDFGLSDAYVGTMKGVLLSICPAARLVDLTHAIQPQNVRQAAYVLSTAVDHFPRHTVFLIVVDPGVGTDRQPIAVETDAGTFVAPSNGVLSVVLARTTVRRAVILDNTAYHLPGVSQTFHGRDIFAPAAAHLASGVPISTLGSSLPELVELLPPALDINGTSIRGEVLHIDRFGNIISSIGRLSWSGGDVLEMAPQFGAHRGKIIRLPARRCRVTVGGTTLHAVQHTYSAVPPGTLLALIGSSGQLEIGLNQGSAAQRLGTALGDPLTLVWDVSEADSEEGLT